MRCVRSQQFSSFYRDYFYNSALPITLWGAPTNLPSFMFLFFLERVHAVICMKAWVKDDILHCWRQTSNKRASDSPLLPRKSLDTSTCMKKKVISQSQLFVKLALHRVLTVRFYVYVCFLDVFKSVHRCVYVIVCSNGLFEIQLDLCLLVV